MKTCCERRDDLCRDATLRLVECVCHSFTCVYSDSFATLSGGAGGPGGAGSGGSSTGGFDWQKYMPGNTAASGSDTKEEQSGEADNPK